MSGQSPATILGETNLEQTAIVALVAAFLGSILGPWVQKLWVEPYALRKQKARNCYEVFVQKVGGLYDQSLSHAAATELCDQYRMAWLYANDAIVRSINQLLQSAKKPLSSPNQGSSEWYLGAAILEMRKQNMGCTQLMPSDYLLVAPGQITEESRNQPCV